MTIPLAECILPVHTFGATESHGMPQKAQFSKSKVSCLVRHRAGNYYASVRVGSKLLRRSLETDDFGTAKLRLPSVLEELRGARNAAEAPTLGEALTAEADRKDPSIKSSTRTYYQNLAKAIQRTGEELPGNPLGVRLSKVTMGELRSLMDEFGQVAAASRYNGVLALMRRTYARAMEAGFVGSNLAEGLKRAKHIQKKHDLPTAEAFAKIVESIRSQGKTHSRATAAAVELLAYTGLRVSEARSLLWKDVKADHLIVRTAKNDSLRQVPLIPAALDLIKRLKAAEIPTGPADPVMMIQSPRFALTGACERLGVDHLRVHDLRHIFATRCIESGVDLPTLASWLGHKDGGVLCAQVYGHLCEKHSTAMAGRVKA